MRTSNADFQSHIRNAANISAVHHSSSARAPHILPPAFFSPVLLLLFKPPPPLSLLTLLSAVPNVGVVLVSISDGAVLDMRGRPAGVVGGGGDGGRGASRGSAPIVGSMLEEAEVEGGSG